VKNCSALKYSRKVIQPDKQQSSCCEHQATVAVVDSDRSFRLPCPRRIRPRSRSDEFRDGFVSRRHRWEIRTYTGRTKCSIPQKKNFANLEGNENELLLSE